MKLFESFMAEQLEEYLAYRGSLGYAEQSQRCCLPCLGPLPPGPGEPAATTATRLFPDHAPGVTWGTENCQRRAVGGPRLFRVPGPSG